MANIFLIGPMGSGKSTVGKSLARKLGYPFFDTDREIESRCGVDIPTIFEFEGEKGFRDRERKIIDELSAITPVVLGTGGGSILSPKNRRILRERGHVILLSVDIKEQLRRVSLNKNRPLLKVDDVEAKLIKLMDERRELYEETAHHVVSTNSSRMQNVIAKIMRHLQKESLVPASAASATTKGSSKKVTPAKHSAKPNSAKPNSSRTSAAKGNHAGKSNNTKDSSKNQKKSGKKKSSGKASTVATRTGKDNNTRKTAQNPSQDTSQKSTQKIQSASAKEGKSISGKADSANKS